MSWLIRDYRTLNTTQHYEVVGCNVASVHSCYHPLFYCVVSSLQTPLDINVLHSTKGQSYIKHKTLLCQYIFVHQNKHGYMKIKLMMFIERRRKYFFRFNEAMEI